jgi:hypothetical protein
MTASEVISLNIDGTCDPAFAAVREALECNFTKHGEIGSAVCVYHQGKKVVDLWGAIGTTRAPVRGTKTPCAFSIRSPRACAR